MKSRIILLAGCCLLLASACVTQKGVDKYFKKYPDLLQMQSDKFFNDHPDLLAQKCSEKYPVKEAYKPGTPVIDETVTPGTVVPCPPAVKDSVTGELKPGTVKCPPSKERTVTIRDTIEKEDTAKLFALEARYKDSVNAAQGRYLGEFKQRVYAEKDRDDWKSKYDKQVKVVERSVIGVIVAIVAFVLIKRYVF